MHAGVDTPNMRRSVPIALVSLAAAAGAAGALAAGTHISTVAGDGTEAFSGDGAAAVLASLDSPGDVATHPSGGFLIADTDNNRIRRVHPNGGITTVAGTGAKGFGGDGGAATQAKLDGPRGVAALNGGGFLISDTGNDVVRRVDSNGQISTVLGTPGTEHDSFAASHDDDSILDGPRGIAALAGGGFLVADSGHNVIRKVDELGNVTIAAGKVEIEGYSGDGGLATLAKLDKPVDVSPLPGGGFLIADKDSNVVRQVDLLGVITTVAGGGASTAEDVPATEVALNGVSAVQAVNPEGFLVAEDGGHRVRRVDIAGKINTVAGTGAAGFSGDDGESVAAQLSSPAGLAVEDLGDVLIADRANNRIREVGLPGSGPGQGNDNAGGNPEKKETIDDAPPPVLGKRVAVAPAKGRIKVRLPGRKGWSMLNGADSLPVGSMLNARDGTVALRTALDRNGNAQTALFWGGVFQVAQKAKAKGLTDITLRGRLPRCKASAGRPKASASRRRRARRARRLWAKDNRGRFRTRGGNSVATTRGTEWLTVDNCKGTLTRVRDGAVLVRNLKTGKKVKVRAGGRFLARRR